MSTLSNINLLAQNVDGKTIFHSLVEKIYLTRDQKYIHVFYKLLQKYPKNIVQESINISSNSGSTVIHFLCTYEFKNLIRMLINNNIRIPFKVNNFNETPIFRLSKYNYYLSPKEEEISESAKISILKQFLDLTYFNPRDLLIQTQETEDNEPEMFLSNVVQTFPDNLIIKYIDILINKIPESIINDIFTQSKNHQDSNVLIIAIQTKKYKTIEKLLSLKLIDINQTNQLGVCPLYLALLDITNNNNYPYILFMLLKELSLNLSTVIYYNGNSISHWCTKGLSPYCVDILRYMVNNDLLDITIERITKNNRTGKSFTKLPLNFDQQNAYELLKINKQHTYLSYQSGNLLDKFKYENIVMVDDYFQCIINKDKHKNEILRVDNFGQYYGDSTILEQTVETNNNKKRAITKSKPGIFNLTGLTDNLFNPKFCFNTRKRSGRKPSKRSGRKSSKRSGRKSSKRSGHKRSKRS